MDIEYTMHVGAFLRENLEKTFPGDEKRQASFLGNYLQSNEDNIADLLTSERDGGSGEEEEENENEDEDTSSECTLGTLGVCKGEIWYCETCKQPFCQTHWHETELGRNVECSSCEHEREEKVNPGNEFSSYHCTKCHKLLINDGDIYFCTNCDLNHYWCLSCQNVYPNTDMDEKDPSYCKDCVAQWGAH